MNASKVTSSDVKFVAMKLGLPDLSSKEVINVMEEYGKRTFDETETWFSALELIFHELFQVPSKDNNLYLIKRIEEAKKLLAENGYAVNTLMSIHDVKVKYKCTDEQAKEVIESFDKNDSITQELNERLGIVAEVFELEEKKECDNCGSTDTWSNSSDELQCNNCGHSETE